MLIPGPYFRRLRFKIALVFFSTWLIGSVFGLIALRMDHDHVDYHLWSHEVLLAVLLLLVMAVAYIVIHLKFLRPLDHFSFDTGNMVDTLKTTMERMPIGCILSDADFRYKYWNPRAEEIFGYSLDEVRGRHPFELITLEERRDEVTDLFGRIALGKMNTHNIGANRTKDGRRIDVQWTNTPLYDEQGKFIGLLAMCEDVTERLRAERELSAMQSRLQMALKGSGTGLWDWDVTSNEVYYSPEFEALLGYAPGELGHVVAKWDGLVHPEDGDRIREKVLECLANPDSEYDVMFRARAWDGEWRWIISRGEVLRDAEGNPLRMIGTQVDITERVRVEEALRESESRFQAFMDNSPAIAFMKDCDGRLLYANRPFLELHGLLGRDWRGRLEHELLPGSYALKYRSNDEAALAADEVMPFEEFYPQHDGEHAWWMLKFPFVDGQGKRMLAGIGLDVTERKRGEEERRALQEQIQHAQKLESLGILAGGIAHDFNNLLTGILGYASLAQLELPPQSPVRVTMQQIELAGQRAAELCRQMLAYAGKGKFVVQPIDLSHLVDEMLQILEVSISKKAELRINLSRALPAVEADPSQLRQVVMNLITNASDALGDQNGVISLTTGVIEGANGLAQGSAKTGGRFVYLEVTDTGCGMDEATQARIFDPFFSTKFTGRGLGLAAVLGIIRGHQGSVNVHSEPGRGSTFKVILPASDRKSELIQQPSSPRVAWHGSGRVLFIDDEPTVRDLGRSILEASGFEVILAVDGREGVDVFSREQGRFDLVILDLTMPRMSGDEVFRELRRLDPEARVILSSGYNEQDATDQLLIGGLAGFMQKPYRADEFIQKVRQVLEHGA